MTTPEIRRRVRPDLAARNRARATHGDTTEAVGYTSEYTAWQSMRRRCGPAANDHERPRYFGRGIRVCDRWLVSFENFLADMGRKPTPRHTLERVNNDGNYEPGNCRWATPREQARNRTSNRLVSAMGLTLTVAEWAERTGLSRALIRYRLEAGWDLHEALTSTPDKTRRRR